MKNNELNTVGYRKKTNLNPYPRKAYKKCWWWVSNPLDF